MKWETAKLGDISTSIQPGPFGSQLHNSDYSMTGTPIIMPKDMINGHLSHENLIYVSDEHVKRLKRHQAYNGNIIVARKGDVRKCVYITENENGWMTGSDCLKVVLDDEICYPKFVYYQLQSPYIGKWLETISIGATMPSLNTGLLSGIDLCLPPIHVQRRIADILSSYDDLIENNQKQIALLEEAAQRLYKEWFVDLRFPGHEKTPITGGVPEGWRKVILGEVVQFNPKISIDKARIKQHVPMSALNSTNMLLNFQEIVNTTSTVGTKFQNNDTLLARITPCLENGKTAFVSGIESDEGAVGSTEFIVMRSMKISPYMVYLLTRTENFRHAAINCMMGSDGRQRVQVNKLMNFDYLFPTVEIINDFSSIMYPIFEKSSRLNRANTLLQEARDRLLPKLMGGEMEV